MHTILNRESAKELSHNLIKTGMLSYIQAIQEPFMVYKQMTDLSTKQQVLTSEVVLENGLCLPMLLVIHGSCYTPIRLANANRCGHYNVISDLISYCMAKCQT